MNAPAAAMWMLIAVTGNGNVSNSTYPTKHLCEEAQSMARYGETLAEYAKREADYQRDEKAAEAVEHAREAAWHRKHPCLSFKPKDTTVYRDITPNTSDIYEYEKTPHGYYCLIEAGMVGTGISIDGPMASPDKGEWEEAVHGQEVIRYATNVKTSECVNVVAPIAKEK